MDPWMVGEFIPLAGMALGGLMFVGVYRLAAKWMDYRLRRGLAAQDPAELQELRQEVERLSGLQERVLELEERVDFAERLLANRPDPDRIA